MYVSCMQALSFLPRMAWLLQSWYTFAVYIYLNKILYGSINRLQNEVVFVHISQSERQHQSLVPTEVVVVVEVEGSDRI